MKPPPSKDFILVEPPPPPDRIRYTCRQCNLATERFRAKDNAPKHECARMLDQKFLEDHCVDLGSFTPAKTSRWSGERSET